MCVCVCEFVCVCVCERERERECVCLYTCVCVYVTYYTGSTVHAVVLCNWNVVFDTNRQIPLYVSE